MWILFVFNLLMFTPFLMCALVYAGLIALVGIIFKSRDLTIYGRNIALGVWDQGTATCLGQDPDISISEALGLAKVMHATGEAHVSRVVLFAADVVDYIFWNPLWKIEENHCENALDRGERMKHTIRHWHYSDADTNSRDVSKYL